MGLDGTWSGSAPLQSSLLALEPESAAAPPVDNADPIEIAFQDGLFPYVIYAGTSDTKISSGNATTNYGTEQTIDVDGSTDIAGLLKWDVSMIPTNSAVISAAIELNVTNTSQNDYEVYALQQAWDELSATWEQFAAGQSWFGPGANGGGDHGDVALGQLAAASNGLQRIELNEAGVAAVQAWISDPDANYGVILKDYLASDGLDFSTSESADATLRPKLIVNYAPTAAAI